MNINTEALSIHELRRLEDFVKKGERTLQDLVMGLNVEIVITQDESGKDDFLRKNERGSLNRYIDLDLIDQISKQTTGLNGPFKLKRDPVRVVTSYKGDSYDFRGYEYKDELLYDIVTKRLVQNSIEHFMFVQTTVSGKESKLVFLISNPLQLNYIFMGFGSILDDFSYKLTMPKVPIKLIYCGFDNALTYVKRWRSQPKGKPKGVTDQQLIAEHDYFHDYLWFNRMLSWDNDDIDYRSQGKTKIKLPIKFAYSDFMEITLEEIILLTEKTFLADYYIWPII